LSRPAHLLGQVLRGASQPHDYSAYGRAFAARYDELYGAEDDVLRITETLLKLLPRAANETRLLELGVGTGRLAVPLARAGVNVTGIDISPEMLDVCRGKYSWPNLRLVCGDVRHLQPLELEPVDIVLFAFNSLLHLLTEDDQRRSLTEARRLLKADGILILEVAEPARVRPILPADVSIRSFSRGHVTARVRCRLVDQRVEGAHVEVSSRGLSYRRFSHRYLRDADVRRMAGAADLVLQSTYADWSLGAAEASGYPTVFVFRPAAPSPGHPPFRGGK